MKKSLIEELFGENTGWPLSTVCCKCPCGGNATYTGFLEDINKAAEEFYKLHEPHFKETEKK